MANFHTDSKKFAPGKSTGVYRGRMKHGAGVEHFKDALHTEQPRNPVKAHEGVASVSATGTKPTQPKTDDGNTAANEAFNQATKGPRERGNVVMIPGR
jgi:hypothetical protein